MKIIEWNCNMAFRKKNAEILKYNPDILIITECESEAKLKFGNLTPIPNDFMWFGDNEHKGIGIFSYSDFRLDLVEYQTSFKYVIPFKILGKQQFNLFTIWAMDSKINWYERYIAQVWLGIQYFSTLLNDNTILVGDFNSNKIWDSKSRIANHTDVVNFLNLNKIHSLYHCQYGEKQGNESQPTFYLHRKIEKSYHIDYCFASEKFVDEGYDLE